MADLIKTAIRERPRGGYSHPVGAELLSSALAGVPQYDQLEIIFEREERASLGLFVPGWPLRHLRGARSHELLGFREILACIYRNGLWNLSVRPVRKERKADIRRILLSVGLPRLKSWLSTPRPDTWFDDSQRVLQIGTSKDLVEVGLLETHNEVAEEVIKVEIEDTVGDSP